jgi:hypothetical protein
MRALEAVSYGWHPAPGRAVQSRSRKVVSRANVCCGAGTSAIGFPGMRPWRVEHIVLVVERPPLFTNSTLFSQVVGIAGRWSGAICPQTS